jgi:uncharacterized membrane protein
MLREFCGWLGRTPISETIKQVSWIIPSVQTVHILAIAVVMSSAVMLDARLLRVNARHRPVLEIGRRYLPWVWSAILVLFATGLILIVGEPGRELLSPVFWIKMSLLACALILTVLIQRLALSGEAHADNRSLPARVMAVASLCLWVSILAAGRLIAYFEHG